MKLTILVDPSLVIRTTIGYYYYILSVSNLCLGVEKKIFKEIHQFYPTDETHQILLRLAHAVVLEKKMLTHDVRRLT